MSKSIREQINLSELFEKVPNRFLLTVAAAKRARQIDDGARPLIDVPNPTTRSLDIALLEIQLGKINVTLDETEEESILDEIADYLDTEGLDSGSPGFPSDNTPKRKQTV